MTPLSIRCAEDSRDQLLCEVQSGGEISLTAMHETEHGIVEEALIYLNRAGAERVYDWLGEWLGW